MKIFLLKKQNQANACIANEYYKSPEEDPVQG
jgi:hypothetical protein